MKVEEIFSGPDEHKWYFIGRDLEKEEKLMDTNQYLIVSGSDSMLLDPAGAQIFPHVLQSVSTLTDLDNVKAIFCSHQDPDIISAIPLWLSVCKNALIYVPITWEMFLAHYGTDFLERVCLLYDRGTSITLGHHTIEFIPAHFLHSAGNFSVYDKDASALFSGDLGGGFFPTDYPMFVENFQEHTKYMELFHTRMMPSNLAKERWIRKVRPLNLNMICPQHGAMFKGKMVRSFLDWLDDLNLGIYSSKNKE